MVDRNAYCNHLSFLFVYILLLFTEMCFSFTVWEWAALLKINGSIIDVDLFLIAHLK